MDIVLLEQVERQKCVPTTRCVRKPAVGHHVVPIEPSVLRKTC